MNNNDLTPPSTDLPDWQADQEREIEEHRQLLDHLLTDARVAITKAIREAEALASETLYDVEVVEGDGRHAPAALQQMLITLAGVRATTVDAYR